MSTNAVEVLNWFASQPVTGEDWNCVVAGVTLSAVAFLVGSAYRLVRRSFGGWESD